MHKTESEANFEAFCLRNGFALLPVPVGFDQTPDYTLTINNTLIVIEVKEVHPTPEELEAERILAEGGVGSPPSITVGKTVRRKIADCAPQIRARTQRKHPGLLVLWERGHCVGRHTEPYHITVAMDGFEQMVLAHQHLDSAGTDQHGGRGTGNARPG